MGLILDTSAVIGWLENTDAGVAAMIESGGEIPLIHIVTIGELCEGVERARAGAPEVLGARSETLGFVRRELVVAPPPDLQEAAVFGLISSVVRRGLSHNDKWILARATIDRHLLVTQDGALHEAASSAALTDRLNAEGLRGPDAALVAR